MPLAQERYQEDMAAYCAHDWQRRSHTAPGLIVTDGVGRVLGVPVVPALGVHRATGSDRTVLVVGKAIGTSPAKAVARATACRGHLEVRGGNSEI